MKTLKLGDCLSLVQNGAVIKQSPNAGGIPITRIETLSNDRFNRNRLGYADIDDCKAYASYLLEDKDILMSHINSRVYLGRAVIYRKEGDETIIHGMNLLRIKTKESILLPEFAYYYFKTAHFKKAIDSIRKDAINQSSFSTFDLKNILITIPSLEEQESIVKVLTSIDAKIQTNERTNVVLESMSRQLYEYWFVQFDFPSAKGPYKSSGGEMIWNEDLKRMIPQGWEVKTLGDIISKLSSGNRPAGGIDKNLKEGIPSLGAECIDRLGCFNYDSTPYVPFSCRDYIRNGIIEDNDILVYKDGAYVGKTTLFRDGFPFKFAAVNEHVFLLHAKEQFMQEYLFYTLLLPTYYEIMQKAGKAKAAQPGLNQDDIKALKILIPKREEIQLFSKTVSKWHKLLFNNALNSAELLKTRKELLPLLINGQVKVEPSC